MCVVVVSANPSSSVDLPPTKHFWGVSGVEAYPTSNVNVHVPDIDVRGCVGVRRGINFIGRILHPVL